MGQCSTLPEARNSSAARHDGSGGMRDRQRLKEDGRTESLDFNKLTTTSNENTKTIDQRKLHVTVPPNNGDDGASFAKFAQMDANQPQTREQDPGDNGMAEPMDVDQRDSAQPIYFPPPPECAVRARCYKLNLDSELVGTTGSAKSHQLCLGPFSEPPPQLTYSGSEDSSIMGSATSVAIQTAQIFRGITISKDGTILSQNARATRSNRGNKTKRGEKSRQAAKIDKAKDLVEEAVVTGIDAETNEPANMVSLVIIGAYDDMKHLVRDGSKKLREAEGLPDDTLLAVNRPRTSGTIGSPVASSSVQGLSSPSQKNRVPPNYVSSQRSAAMQMPDKSRTPLLPQSAPPKLKSNPRDRPSRVRRSGDDKQPRRGFITESCNDNGGNNGEDNWSHALGFSRGFHSIWNCGGADEGGTVSPTQVCSPRDVNKPHVMDVNLFQQSQQQPAFEGRESALGHREGEVSNRAN